MNATITGHDSLSKQILVALNSGLGVSEVPEQYPVSLDQAKRLSRYRKMLELAKANLDEEQYNRLLLLGLKSLPLSNLFKKSDWGGLAEILSVVTDDTKRDELQLLIDALEEKRKRISDFKEEVDLVLRRLEDTDKTLVTKEKELLQLQKEMDEHVEIFKGYSKQVRSFLLEYIGLCDGQLVLVKRLNVNWQRALRKKGIIVYDDEQYIHILKDLDTFVEELSSRIKSGLEYHWDPEKDLKRITKSSPWSNVSRDGKYSLSTAFNKGFVESINLVKAEIDRIQQERAEIKQEFKKIKQQTIHSYMEMAEVSDFLSTMDLKRHKELQNKALKWLYQRGFIAVAEFTLPNGKRADIFAFNDSQIAILEVKVSRSDLVTDQKWTEYLPYCHEFYFLTPSELVSEVSQKISEVNCGQFVENGNSIKMVRSDAREITVENAEELKFAAGQLLSRKFVYGY